MLASIRIEDIEAAIEVTACRHFTRAGENLHRSQGAISKSVKRVEGGLGVTLVDRSAHPVQLTKAGMAFRYHARRALDSLGRGISAAQRADQPDHAVLQVGYTSYLDLDLVAYLGRVGQSPEAGFSHHEHSSSSSEVIAFVISGKWDCGLIISPATTDGLVGIPIYQDPFGVVLANDHPLSRRRKIKIEELCNVPLILPSKERNPGFRAWFVERCAAVGVNLKIAHEVSNPHEAWFMASQHAGAALIPQAASQNLPKGTTVFRLISEDDFYAEVQLVFRDEPQSPMLASFVATALRMRDRIKCGEMRTGPVRAPVIPRPVVKPWKHAQNMSNAPRAIPA
jgi:DNA-binding transcriptional LysR family regulator